MSDPIPVPIDPALTVVAVNGSPSHPSRSRALAQRALELLGGGRMIDLAELDPGALLALSSDPGVDEARDAIASADILVIATPVYRATYTALTKSIFDLLPQAGLAGTVVIPIASGFGADHRLAVDHGLRPLVASLEGWTTPTGVYATRDDVDAEGAITETLGIALDRATREARFAAGALAAEEPSA